VNSGIGGRGVADIGGRGNGGDSGVRCAAGTGPGHSPSDSTQPNLATSVPSAHERALPEVSSRAVSSTVPTAGRWTAPRLVPDGAKPIRPALPQSRARPGATLRLTGSWVASADLVGAADGRVRCPGYVDSDGNVHRTYVVSSDPGVLDYDALGVGDNQYAMFVDIYSDGRGKETCASSSPSGIVTRSMEVRPTMRRYSRTPSSTACRRTGRCCNWRRTWSRGRQAIMLDGPTLAGPGSD
jgi:hypothetical protein